MSATTIKILMVIFMIMDHVVVFFPDIFPIWFRYFGRIVSPTFLYLVIYNFKNTSKQLSYILRLLYITIIIYIGNFLLGYIFNDYFLVVYNVNIFASITTTLLVIYFFDKLYKVYNDIDLMTFKKISRLIVYILSIIILAIFSISMDGSIAYVILGIIFYNTINDRPKLIISYIIFTIIIYLLTGNIFFNNIGYLEFQYFMIFALIPILGFNYTYGKYRLKYFFYIFYPLHLWLLFIMRNLN